MADRNEGNRVLTELAELANDLWDAADRLTPVSDSQYLASIDVGGSTVQWIVDDVARELEDSPNVGVMFPCGPRTFNRGALNNLIQRRRDGWVFSCEHCRTEHPVKLAAGVAEEWTRQALRVSQAEPGTPMRWQHAHLDAQADAEDALFAVARKKFRVTDRRRRVDEVVETRLSTPVEVTEDDNGPALLGLRLELWWLRRRLAWQLRNLPADVPDGPVVKPTYRRRAMLLQGALSATTIGTSLTQAVHMVMETASLPGLITTAFEIFGVIWLVWLMPMRFWRADRPTP